VEEWHIPGKTAGKRVRYRLRTRTVERLSARLQTVLATFLGFRKPLYSCTEGMCHSSKRPGTSYHVTQFYQAFPRVSTASDKRWGEKALVRGYSYAALEKLNQFLPLQMLQKRNEINTTLSFKNSILSSKYDGTSYIDNCARFNRRNQQSGETAEQYITELYRLAEIASTVLRRTK